MVYRYELPTVKGPVRASFKSEFKAGINRFTFTVILPLGMDARISLPLLQAPVSLPLPTPLHGIKHGETRGKGRGGGDRGEAAAGPERKERKERKVVDGNGNTVAGTVEEGDYVTVLSVKAGKHVFVL